MKVHLSEIYLKKKESLKFDRKFSYTRDVVDRLDLRFEWSASLDGDRCLLLDKEVVEDEWWREDLWWLS
jgi:hypothetical protein